MSKRRSKKVDYDSLSDFGKIQYFCRRYSLLIALGVFLLLWLITGIPQIAFGFAAVVGASIFKIGEESNEEKKAMKFTFNSSDEFDIALAAIIASLVKADGKISSAEIEYVEKKIKIDYFQVDAERILKHIKVFLERPKVDISYYTKLTNENFTISEKIQLLHLFVGLAVADKYLTLSEENLLQKITREIGIPYRTLDSILAMYRFQREFQEKKERPKSTQKSALAEAFKILEIDAAATAHEIKKAYKKLAVIHHPDKVAHLGEDIQKKAAEKFKIIAGAYDLICDAKGIV